MAVAPKWSSQGKQSRQGRIVSAATLATAVLAAQACSVQGVATDDDADYPTEAVELTVPSSPGGSTDLIARALAQDLEDPLDTTINVVNKEGANGKIAAQDVFSSDPDGYRLTLMMQSLFSVTPLVLDDPDAVELEDMTFIKGISVEDYVLVVPEDSEYETIEDLLEADGITYATSGAGTGGQLSQAALFGLAEVDAEDVPFDGGAPAMTAVLGGQVDAGAAHTAEVVGQVEAGEMRPLLTFAEERLEAFPEVPTATEIGHDIVVDQRRFVAAPAGLPDEVRDTLVDAIDEAVASEEYGQTLEQNYIGRWEVDGDEVGEQLTSSLERYTELVDDLGLDLSDES